MSIDVNQELCFAKQAIEGKDYCNALVSMRKVAEEVSKFYVSRNGKLGEVLKRELGAQNNKRSASIGTYSRALQTYYGGIKDRDSFNKHLSLFVYQAALFGNKGAHESGGGEGERYKAVYMVSFFEEFILPTYERDQDRARYADVTRDFAGRRVKVRSAANQMYVSANEGERDSPLQATARGASAWEAFAVEVDKSGWAALRACHSGMWVSARGDIDEAAAPLTASAQEPSRWEQFKVFSDGAHHYVRSRLNGRWVSCQIDSEKCEVLASAREQDAWEAFDITDA